MSQKRSGSGGDGPAARKPAAKRARGIGAAGIGDDTARLVAAHHLAEHVGQGWSYLSTRPNQARGTVRSLLDISLEVSAEGLLEALKLPHRVLGSQSAAGVRLVGWNRERDDMSIVEVKGLRDFVEGLPSNVANRLLDKVLRLSAKRIGLSKEDDPAVSVLSLAGVFLHPNATSLSLSSLSAPALLLSKIPNCTALTNLDLSGHTSLADGPLAKILAELPVLQTLNLRGCTKVGNQSVIAISKAAESRLLSINLSLTAVTIKGLTSLLARCSRLEVLKLANIGGLNSKAITQLVDDATAAALGWRHIPLSNLHTLKLRSTDINDSSLGRLLALCALSLQRLDISYTQVKSLDIVSQALHTAPSWNLAKLCASGLPLGSATLVGFFQPLSLRAPIERSRFKTLKLGAIPSTSSKCPGLTDAVLSACMPWLEQLEGLESISLYQNWGLGKGIQPMRNFMERIGRRCITLDLTLTLESYHLDGLFVPLPSDNGPSLWYSGPAKLQTLILDSSRITDAAAEAIASCPSLRALHVAETKITTRGLLEILAGCPDLSILNLTSCRGIPVAQRRTFFEAYARGEVSPP